MQQIVHGISGPSTLSEEPSLGLNIEPVPRVHLLSCLLWYLVESLVPLSLTLFFSLRFQKSHCGILSVEES